MTVCPKCNGRGTVGYFHIDHFVDIECDRCNGSGEVSEVEMTNEEWIKQANTEQLAEWLQEHMDCASCGCDKDLCYQGYDCCKLAFEEWLKQPHHEKERAI